MLGSGGGIPGGSSGRDCTRRYATTTIFHRVQPLRKRAIGRLLVDGMRRLGPTFDVCSIPGRGAGWPGCAGAWCGARGCWGLRGDADAWVHAGMPGFRAAEAVQEEGGGGCPCLLPVAPCPRPLFLPIAPSCACRPSGRLGARGVAARCAPGRALRPSGVFSGLVPGWSRACPPAWRPAWSRAVRNGPGVWRTWGSGGSGGPAVLADRRSSQDPADLGSHHRAVRLTARWYDELVRLPWRRSVCGRCAAGIGRCAAGRGKRARRTCPMCDFPLPAHRETAPCGMLWITFVHIPGPSGTGDACGGIDGCDRSDPCRGGQAGPRRP